MESNRVLVVAHRSVATPSLIEELQRQAESGPVELALLIPDASDPAVAEYYLPAGAQWQRWSSTRNITLPDGTYTGGPAPGTSVTGAGNAPVYANYIAHSYFSLVALNFIDTTALDRQITAALRRNHHYHVVQVVPYGMELPPVGQGNYVIWQYQASTKQSGYTPNR